ncbi:MAG: tyrosine-protein kinase, partial [Micromonosporaceae bacterium]|nr:tyrosine-protein kinase [Micromonosporaceae bacterium]
PLLPVTDAAIIGRATGGALLVVRLGSTRTDQLWAAAHALRNVDANILGLVANRVKRKSKSAYGAYYTAQPAGRRSRAIVPSDYTAAKGAPVTERHRRRG